MKRTYSLVMCALLLSAVVAAAWLVPRSLEDAPLRVVATTSVLASVVQDLTDGDPEAVALVPPGSCPGHFDMKVQHLRLIEDSGVLLAHGFEPYLPDIRRAVGRASFEPVLIPLDTGWLTGEGVGALYARVGERLSEHYPGEGDRIRRGLERALDRAAESDRMVRSLAVQHGFAGRRVLCNDHMKDHLEGMGLNVVATYGRREDLSPSGIRDLIRTGREHGVALIVDNMQAGADTGRVLADAIGAAHVAISNFPGVLPGAETLYATRLANAERIAGALQHVGNP